MQTTPFASAVAAVVKRHIAAADLTDRELAAITSIPRTTLMRRLHGDPSGFTTHEIAALAEVFGTTASAIYAEAERAA